MNKVKSLKNCYTLTLEPVIVERAKEIAGLVPFSRYVESLLLREIQNQNDRALAINTASMSGERCNPDDEKVVHR